MEVFGLSEAPTVDVLSGSVSSRVEPLAGSHRVWRVTLRAPAGVTAYSARLRGPGLDQVLSGTIVAARWDCVFFPWRPEADPREKLVDWRRLTSGLEAVRGEVAALDFPYGWSGPRDQGARVTDEIRRRGPGGDHFGMIARTRLALPKGEWRFAALSDDGLRVTVAGRQVIENWTWHGPTRDEGTFVQDADGEVDVEVEHFEIDGYSVLRLEIEPAGR